MSVLLRSVDLCHEPESRVQGAAFYALKDLARGQRVVLMVPYEPSSMMRSLDLQLRRRLAWECAPVAGSWRVEVRHRDDVASRDAIEMLARDHQRLDGLFIGGMQLLNRGDTAAAACALGGFAAALRRHIHAEDTLLAPVLGASEAPLAVMLREHAEILGQLALIEECLAGGAQQAGETQAFCAILSGTLAKHEHREESSLFPLWRGRLARLPAAQQETLMTRVEVALRGEGGEAIGGEPAQ